LVRYDGEHKPAFTTIQRLLQRTLDAGAPFQTSPLELRVTASADTSQHILLQRRDGTHLLVLWNEVISVDASSGQLLTPPKLSVTVQLAASRSYALFRPLLGAEATESGRAEAIQLAVPDDVLILELSAP